MILLLAALGLIGVATAVDVPEFPKCAGGDASLEDYVKHADVVVRDHALPFWRSKVDFKNGGYDIDSGERTLVEQARMLWIFSDAMLNGYHNDKPTNRQSADAGLGFLLKHFLDKEHDGYYWSTDEKGKVIDSRKHAYGLSVAMYSLSAYSRAFGDPRAANAALDLFRVFRLRIRGRPGKFDGWLEHFERDWTPITSGHGSMGKYGETTSNCALHFMEALSELFRATGNQEVRTVLHKVLTDYIPHYYPQNPAEAVAVYGLPGNIVETGAYDYGHLVEYARLRMEAEVLVGKDPDWPLFHRYVNYVIERRSDITKGVPSISYLEWWPQFELLSAISVAKKAGRGAGYENTLKDILDLIYCKFLNSKTRLPYWSLELDGSIRDGTIASRWKVGYHNQGAFMKFVDAFGAE